jgi:hypothetical protein
MSYESVAADILSITKKTLKNNKNAKKNISEADFAPAKVQPKNETELDLDCMRGSGSGSDSNSEDRELDIKFLRELQRRKELRERDKKNRSDKNHLSQFPSDFSNEELLTKITGELPEAEKELLNKIRYTIHAKVMKLAKKNKLQRINEIPITFSEGKMSLLNLLQIRSELENRGFGCEFSDERTHRVKYQKPGVILYLSIVA